MILTKRTFLINLTTLTLVLNSTVLLMYLKNTNFETHTYVRVHEFMHTKDENNLPVKVRKI